MKKLIAFSILLTLLSAAAFAQFTAQLSVNFFPELMTSISPTGDFAEKELNSAPNPDYKGTSKFRFFNSTRTYYWDAGNELRLALGYTSKDKDYGARAVIRGDTLIGGIADGNTTAPHDFLTGDGDQVQILDLITGVNFDNYEVWGKIGKLTGYVSNYHNRGVVDRYQSFHEFMDRVKMDSYGILEYTGGTLKTVANNAFVTNDRDANNWNRHYGSHAWNARPVFAVVGKFDPISVTLAGSNEGAEVINPSTGQMTGTGSSKGNAFFRVSGEKIADIINFDVVYRIDGEDTSLEGSKNGTGKWTNVAGVYANINAVETLGLGIGYTARFDVREKNDDMNYIEPFYSGVDLRVKFTGVEKLTVTSNHNVSFAGVKGTDPSDDKTTNGISGTYGKDESEDYFAMYNSLAVAYKVTDAFTANLQVGNRLGIYNSEKIIISGQDAVKTTNTYDRFRAVAFAGYSLNSHVSLSSGLALDIQGSTEKRGDADKVEYGYFTIGIPVNLKIVY